MPSWVGWRCTTGLAVDVLAAENALEAVVMSRHADEVGLANSSKNPHVEELPRVDREPISVRLQENYDGFFSSTVMSPYFEI